MLSLEDTQSAPRAATTQTRPPQGRAPLMLFREFLERPKQVAYILPSSPALERRIVRVCDVANAKTVVELGPGTGGTTRALLRHMAPDARLMAIEINPRFAAQVREAIDDPRLIVHNGDASKIGDALALHGIDAPDVVVSGIPFSCMSLALGEAIQESIRGVLAPGGRFVAYQLRDAVEKIGTSVFGNSQACWEWANLPPMRVFRFDKAAG